MISYIVVTYNSAATIADCLQSIMKDASADAEIIVIDNASSDRTRELIQAFGKVTFIPLESNIGFGGANQVGFEAAHGELIVFLNPDTVIPVGFSEKVENFFNTQPNTGILGCLIANEDGSIERTGNSFPSFFSLLYEYSAYKYLFPRSSAYRKFIIAGWDRTTARAIDAVSGACFVMKRETLIQIGGFDRELFLYFEEFDLARRVREVGKQVFYEPAIRVQHIGQVSTNQLPSSRRQTIYDASCRYYVLKYHGRLYSTLLWATVALFNIPRYGAHFLRKVKRDGKI